MPLAWGKNMVEVIKLHIKGNKQHLRLRDITQSFAMLLCLILIRSVVLYR